MGELLTGILRYSTLIVCVCVYVCVCVCVCGWVGVCECVMIVIIITVNAYDILQENWPFAGPGHVTYPPLNLRPGTL